MTLALVPQAVHAPVVEKFTIGTLGLEVTGHPTYDEWIEFGTVLHGLKQSLQWNIGDWIEYGEWAYGEKYAQAEDETKFSNGYLRTIALTARTFPKSERRVNVPFSTHTAIAYLPDDKRTYVLDMCERGEWTRGDVRGYQKQLKTGNTYTLETITLQWRWHTVKDGILTVAFVEPEGVYEIVGFKAIVKREKSA
jgi:hypothetical protein